MMEDFIKHNVSRETIDQLKKFQDIVLEWNNKFNLIAKSTINNIWERHIVDSAQLFFFINKEDKKIYDFGSGAGFPAIVLAIMCKYNLPNTKISMIESVGKKALFLKEVIKILDLNAVVINNRIEKITLPPADIITSRALASLDKLLQYSEPFCSKKTRLIFPKGEKWSVEVAEAQKKWIFDCNVENSKTSELGRVLCIENIRRK